MKRLLLYVAKSLWVTFLTIIAGIIIAVATAFIVVRVLELGVGF